MARKKGRRNKPFKVNIKKDTMNSILAILVIGIGGLIAVSFSQQGIYETGSLFLGWTFMLLPFVFVVGGLMLTSAKLAIASPHVLLGSVITLISLAGLTKSGQVGEQIFVSVSTLISTAGGILFYLIGTLIGLFILFETSIEDLIVLFQSFIDKLQSASGKFKGVSLGKRQEVVFQGKTAGIKINTHDEQLSINPPPSTPEPVKPALKESASLSTITSNRPEGASDVVWQYPPLNLLSDQKLGKADRGDINKNVEIIQDTLSSFSIAAKVIEVNYGPAVTQYALRIAMGTKVSKINALQSDLALALSAPQGQIRIEACCQLSGSTGVEMEALTAASVAALTIYDMCKAVDKAMTISDLRLLEKTGGKSGHYQFQPEQESADA